MTGERALLFRAPDGKQPLTWTSPAPFVPGSSLYNGTNTHSAFQLRGIRRCTRMLVVVPMSQPLPAPTLHLVPLFLLVGIKKPAKFRCPLTCGCPSFSTGGRLERERETRSQRRCPYPCSDCSPAGGDWDSLLFWAAREVGSMPNRQNSIRLAKQFLSIRNALFGTFFGRFDIILRTGL